MALTISAKKNIVSPNKKILFFLMLQVCVIFLFAILYYIVIKNTHPNNPKATFLDMIHFSLYTQTTVGYDAHNDVCNTVLCKILNICQLCTVLVSLFYY